MQSSKQFWRGLFFILLVTALCGGMALPAVSLPARAAPQMDAASHIVISQVYGGGGNSGATFKNDFIELFNRGTIPVDLTGWSVQYTSAGSTTWTDRTNLSGSIAPGQYYLIQEAAGSGGTIDLPTPDATGTIMMGANAGKVALVNTTTALSGSGCPFDASVIDFVGYGTTADCFEGSGRSPAPSSSVADLRSSNGCNDTNNNSVDFTTGTPTPRNSLSPANPCTPITITGVTSPVADTVYTTGDAIDITVTFSGIVNVAGLPTLLLETGVIDRFATYVSGDGSPTLIFRYTVQAGDSSADLDYVATNSLSGETITGATGEAILTLPSPASPGSLGANKNIVIDTPPSVISFSRQTPGSQSTNADSLVFRATFSEAVSNVDVSDFIVTGTTGIPTLLTLVSADVYDITVTGGDLQNLNGTVGLDLSPTHNIVDATGNSLPTTEPTTDETFTLDNLAPTVTVNQATGQVDPATALPISFTVVFSEPINASTFASDDISQATNATSTGVTWTVANSGDNRTFTLRATAVTGPGTLIPVIAAGRVMDLAGNSNAVSTSSDNTITYSATSSVNVLINEVAWGGTVASANDEWIELYNPSTTATVNLDGWTLRASDGTPTINLTGETIAPNDFLLLARNDGTFGGGLTPDVIYGQTALNNNGEILSLVDAGGRTVDTANSDGGPWPAGLASPTYASMERVVYANQWVTFAGTVRLATDRDNNPVNGTPGISNWITSATVTTITSDQPDPSLVNQDVTVNVTVIGGNRVPVGRVNITGANTNCSITSLSSSGTGSCRVRFTSTGSKTITAAYLGNTSTGHAPSTDTESHSVSTTTVRTPTRMPTPRPPPPLIAINEFVPRPGHDWNNDGVINVGDEFIELINHGVIDVNLSGYTLDDEVNIGSTPFRLPSVTLRPGERRVFYGSETNLLLSDGGDGVRLILPNGQLGDAFNYRVVRFPDQSYCRLPDNGGLDDWNENCFPTPGLQNSLAGIVNPPTSGNADDLCPIADTLPTDFVLAECPPFGNNIWNPAYWDRNGWYNERFLPESPGKWNVFAD